MSRKDIQDCFDALKGTDDKFVMDLMDKVERGDMLSQKQYDALYDIAQTPRLMKELCEKTSRSPFEDSILAFYNERGFITKKQRAALMKK